MEQYVSLTLPTDGEPGATTFFACQYDQRFSYCLYVPLKYDVTASQDYPLLVVVHGSHRNAESYRDALADWAEEHQTVVLSPLFPSGIIEPGESNNYKQLLFHDIRYDLVLLAMVEETAAVYRIRRDRFMLYGYSGGGQFAHRFLYIHPERLQAVSIGAPGSVTLVNDTLGWWPGTANVEELFGRPLDLEKVRAVPVQMVVGSDDTGSMAGFDSKRVMPGSDRAGRTRVERLETLRANFEAHGIGVEYTVVPGVGHESYKFLPVVTSYFSTILETRQI
jgi:poly(3-hydroxybutyrate) depolymerase